MLGLGLGLNKNKLIQNNAQLVKSAGGVLYLDARKATGTGKTTAVNTPFVDLSGKGNNATLTNFAGTTSSGYDISDPIRPFLRFDGTDDYGALVNTPSIDITSAPLAVFVTVNIPTTGNFGIMTKGSTATETQYGLLMLSGIYSVRISNPALTTFNSNTSTLNAWVNFGFIWDGANLKMYANGVQSGATNAFNGTLASFSYPRIGARGTGTPLYMNGKLATVTIYAGVNATESRVLKAEKALSKAYIGG